MSNQSFREYTLGSGISVGLCLLIFEPFSQGYMLIRYPTFISFWNLAQGYAKMMFTVDAFDLFENVNIENETKNKFRPKKDDYVTIKNGNHSLFPNIGSENLPQVF